MRPVPKSRRQYVLQSAALAMARELQGVRKGKHPDFIEPMLATLQPKPPTDDKGVHEIKFDGYRVQAHVGDGSTKFFTRRGHDWSPRFKEVGAALWDMKTHAAILDGEVIVPTKTGVSDFGALESDLGAGRSDRLVYYVFDLLYLDGLDLRLCMLVDRKRVLKELLAAVSAPVMYSEHLEVSGPTMFKRACGMGLEGIVS